MYLQIYKRLEKNKSGQKHEFFSGVLLKGFLKTFLWSTNTLSHSLSVAAYE